jgi:diguanylate cyclase (GGDEF)-like protein
VKPNCNSLDSCLRSVPDWLQVLLALAAVAGLTVFKLTIGQSVSVIDFLFVPIVAVGWFARRRWLGYAVAGIAAVDTAFVAMTAETQATLAAAAAAALVRFCLYLVVLELLGMMRRERAGDQRAAFTDQLTGAANARAFKQTAGLEVERAQRYLGPISVAYLDIDDFKSVNDALGHGEGDHVLAQTGHVLRSTLRATDTAARIGGDEFAVLMPQTGSAGAAALMERVRGELDRLTLADGGHVCFSVGLATFERPPSSVGELMSAADGMLYRAKRAGKGRMERASQGAPRSAPGPLSDGRHTRDLIAR